MVEVRRLPDATLITVRCTSATLNGVSLPPGVAFPRDANRFVVGKAATCLWTGPDDWLVMVEEGDGRAMLAALEAAFADRHAAVVETSGNRVRLRVAGPGARDLMARACSLDLDPPHFAPGHCAGTMIARAQAILMQRDAGPSYDILVRRSLAFYLEAWLLSAARALPV